MIANVVYISLNARGGAERLAVVTLKTLCSMGIDVELKTVDKPDMALIRKAYGESAGLDIKKISRLDLLGKDQDERHDLTINTHGDMLPYFRENFSKKILSYIAIILLVYIEWILAILRILTPSTTCAFLNAHLNIVRNFLLRQEDHIGK